MAEQDQGNQDTGAGEGMYGDMSGVTGDMNGCEGDMTGCTGDVTGCSGDMTDCSGDITGCEGDMTGVLPLTSLVATPDSSRMDSVSVGTVSVPPPSLSMPT